MSLFNIGLSGLNTAQNALTTVGHNMSNAATTGYTRQNTIIASAGGISTGVGFFGQGSNTTTVMRVYDQFLTGQLRGAESASAELAAYADQIAGIDTLLADQKGGISPLMQKFFAAVQAVADKPGDTAVRQGMLNAAESLAGQMRAAATYFQQQQEGINDQLKSSVTQINAYARQIASLNSEIVRAQGSSGGQPANDLLDQRDQLVSELNKLVGAKVVVQDSGTYNVFIGNGQPLVVGASSYDLKAVQSEADSSRIAIAYTLPDGSAIEMEDSIFHGGTIGGLMKYRSESLDGAQNAIGRIALTLTQTFNEQHRLGMDLNGAIGEDLFAVGSPVVIGNRSNTGTGTLTVNIADAGALATSDYTLSFDGSNYSILRMSDNKVMASGTGPTFTVDGVEMTVGGTMNAGDSFQIQPTRNVAASMELLISDPAKVAAASPVLAETSAANIGKGTVKVSNIDAPFTVPPSKITATFDGTTYTFEDADGNPVVPDDGPTANGTAVEYTFDGVTVSFDGTPKAGDQFTIGSNAGGTSDNGNALMLAKLQTAKTINGTSSFNDAYGQLINNVGSRAKSVDIQQTSQDSVTTQIRTAQQGVSGVNMDEETVSLLRYQQLYQASAQVIQTASSLFDTIIAIA
ncbi:flagellar hook-associated protein 1 FlgK [Cupriavidus gilardii J11]|uniref:Flagellar hook-associated protein 1 n=1 Tax=Cupriavidus gilardii J11 TaxID=936133 RepID=A0A562BG33_9BURK|nr:flagellar hook-associated protein FlgK [Cupriavidus gilardii]TWG84088.1 flagellar hook-associated protein 1 FlgK [Cupriavidus gilardii J11]